LFGFREINDTDIEDEYLNSLNNKQYMKYSEQSQFEHTFLSQKNYLSSFNNSTTSLIKGVHKIAIQNLVGVVNATAIDREKSICNAGILMFHSFSSQRAGSIIWQRWIEFLHNQEGIQDVFAGTRLENLPMRRLCEKAQMQEVKGFDRKLESNHIFYVHRQIRS
jgi:RimJ/RimL family protein N-acetyltransferase